jgi:hypothetical protein
VAEEELPHPHSEELASLLGSNTQRLLYGLLYRRRYNPPTIVELRMFAADALGEDQSQTDRRDHELRRYFDIPAKRIDDRHVYVLKSWAQSRPTESDGQISLRRRAQVLAPQRCAQCGKTSLEDGVKLEIDHKIPRAWGGSNELENLQPLCTDRKAGKRD